MSTEMLEHLAFATANETLDPDEDVITAFIEGAKWAASHGYSIEGDDY